MLVVCHHAALLALKYLEFPENSAHRMQWDLANAGVFGVDIFFVISGFVMAMSARRFDGGRGAIHFLAQRYNRIAPLFYLLSALLLADMLRAQVPFDVRDVLNTLTFVPWFDGREYHWPIHYLGWTLAFEFVFYGVVAALIWSGGGRHVVLLAAILAGLALAGALYDAPWMPLRMLTSPTMVEFGFGRGSRIAPGAPAGSIAELCAGICSCSRAWPCFSGRSSATAPRPSPSPPKCSITRGRCDGSCGGEFLRSRSSAGR